MNARKLWVSVAGVVAIVLIAVGVYQLRGSDGTGTEQVSDTNSSGSGQGNYKNGSYSATGSYRSPAGPETVTVSLVLENGMVKQATFTGNGTNPGTKKWQGAFKAGFEQQVVGKNIDQISLTVVNGSSLTPKGFMDALSQIKTQAKA